jgi:hypothetical protein
MPSDALFYRNGTLDDTLSAYERKIRGSIDTAIDAKLGTAPDDEIAKSLAAEMYVSPLRFRFDRVTRSAPKDVEIDISGNPMSFLAPGDSPFVKGTRLEFFLPFEGDATLLHLRTNPHSSQFPRGDIEGERVVIAVEGVNLEPAVAKQRLDTELALLKECAERSSIQVTQFNERLVGLILDAVKRRGTERSKHEQLGSAFDFPLEESREPVLAKGAHGGSPRRSEPTNHFEYDVALSFAGEDRTHAEALAMAIRSAGFRVFYDAYEQGELWGADLYERLHEVYSRKARYCVLFASKHYAQKVWTTHERRAAQERALTERAAGYILPIRVDDTTIPGLQQSIGYLPISMGIPAIARMLTAKLARPTN